MPRGRKASCPLIIKMIPFVNISNFFKGENIYVMTFRVACWDTLDNSLVPFVNISNFFKGKNIYVMTFRVACWDTLDNSLVF